MDKGSTVRKWLLLFILFDLVLLGLFLGIRAICCRKIPEGERKEVTVTELAS